MSNNNEKKNTISLIKEIQSFIKSKSPEMNRFEIGDHFCIKIGSVDLRMHPDGYYIVLSEKVNKEYLRLWKQDVGKILALDKKRGNLNKYYEFKYTDNLIGLVRCVTPDIETDIDELGLATIKYGDNRYLFIRFREDGNTYTAPEPGYVFEPTPTVEPMDSYESDDSEPTAYELF